MWEYFEAIGGSAQNAAYDVAGFAGDRITTVYDTAASIVTTPGDVARTIAEAATMAAQAAANAAEDAGDIAGATSDAISDISKATAAIVIGGLIVAGIIAWRST